METGISLRVKFSAILTGVIVLLGISIVWFIRTSVCNHLTAEMQKRAEFIAQDVASESVDAILTMDVFALQSITLDHAGLHEDIFYVFITDPEGNILAHSFGAKFPTDLMKPSIVANVGAGRTTRLETNKGVVFDVSSPVLKGQVGAVHVGILGKSIEEKVTAILWEIILIIIGILVLGYILAMYFVSFIVKPLRELTRAAEALGRGDLTQRAQVAAHDETGALADAFNEMAEDLTRTTTSITTLNDEIAVRKRVEGALRESEERFRSLVGNIPGAVYRCEIPYPWAVELISEAVFEITGYHAEDLLEGRIQGIGALIVAEDVEDVKRLVAAGVAAHRPFELSYRIRHATGGVRWVDEKGQAIYDADGRPLWLDGIILDITEGKKVEEDLKKAYDKLERSEQQFRSVVETATSAIISADKNGNIVFWNNAAEKTFGYSAEEILNKPLTTIMPQRYHKAHLKGFNHLIETGKSRIRDRAVELFGLKKNGSEFPLELFLSKWKIEGDIFFTAIINDTTDRKRAEERLKDSEKRSRAWLENSPVCTKILDLDFNLQYMSRAGIDGLKIDDITEFYGKPFPLYFYPDSARHSMTKCLEKVRETGEIVTGETPLLDLEGNEVWYYATFVPVKNDEGQIEYIIIVSVDTTERKRAEQERERLLKTLAAKNEELQSIVYVASHDLKSPLVNIQGFSGELSRTCEQIDEVLRGAEVPADIQKQLAPLLDEDIPESISFICAGTVKMQALLNGLLEVCRVGSAVLQIKAIDMNKMTKHIIASMQYQITDSGAELTADDLPGCIGDPDHVNQVFSNLLANAVKYLDPDRKGEIHISGRVEAGESIYCVRDNGLGIAPQHQQKVFEIFHRLEPGGDVEGEGLGLTIALRILERHEGRIWVESEPGKGSKFFVSLPTA